MVNWYKRDPHRALDGMTVLSLDECGAYNLILDKLYANDGDLNDDDYLMARLLRVQRRTWRSLKDRLTAKGKIWVINGKICAKKVEKTLKEAEIFSEKQSKNAKKRWFEDENTNDINETPMPNGNAFTTTPTTTPTKKIKTPTESLSMCDAYWQPNLSHFEIGKSRGLSEQDVNEEARAMRDWSLGSGRKKRDWDRTFNNWLRKAKSNGRNGRHETLIDTARRLYDRAAEIEAAKASGRADRDDGGDFFGRTDRSELSRR